MIPAIDDSERSCAASAADESCAASPAIVVEAALAETLAPDARLHLLAVSRRRRRGRPWRAAGWRALDPDLAVRELSRAPAGALVLARDRAADPGAAALRPLALLLRRDVLVLPEPLEAAAWTLALAVRWAATGHPRLKDAVSVAIGLAGADGPLPRVPWGSGGLRLPALRPRVLGRWATLAWRACDGCRSGGGLAGAACPGCGAAMPLMSNSRSAAKQFPFPGGPQAHAALEPGRGPSAGCAPASTRATPVPPRATRGASLPGPARPRLAVS